MQGLGLELGFGLGLVRGRVGVKSVESSQSVDSSVRVYKWKWGGASS